MEISFLDSYQIFGTPLLMWLVAFLAIIILGISKSGVKGISIIMITMLVYVYGGKHSSGVLMPMLIAADILAITYYRKHVKWEYLIKLMPAIVVGVLIGTLIGKDLNEFWFKNAMIGIILVSVAILWYWEKNPPKEVPDNWIFSSVLGLAAGITTMIGHLAGPFANIYFLSMRMPKNEFIGTAAWLFFIINLIKLPLHIFVWSSVNMSSIQQSISLVPALLLGFLLGINLVKRIKDRNYRQMIIVLTGIAALILLAKQFLN